MWARSLGQEDPLEWEMATHSSILAWRIPWTKEPGGLQSMGFCIGSDMTEQVSIGIDIVSGPWSAQKQPFPIFIQRHPEASRVPAWTSLPILLVLSSEGGPPPPPRPRSGFSV